MFDGGTTDELLAALAAAPDPTLAAVLNSVNPSACPDEVVLAAIGGWERVIAWATARQAQAVAAFARQRRSPLSRPDDWIDEFAVCELATELHLTQVGACNKVAFARRLEELPLTATALEEGQLDVRQARVIIEGTANLDDCVASAVEARVIVRAPQQTTGQLRSALARAVIAADPNGAERRHAAARQERRVTLQPAGDGMASLWALLPADGAMALRRGLEAAARADRFEGDTRTADNRRADALVRLCSAGAAGAVTATVAPVADVRVVIDAATLLKLQDQPGHLAGYGPIPASLARTLAADGEWRRLVVEPLSGDLLDAGRRRYRPSCALAEFVKNRDVTCRFPGCRRTAHEDDLDHVVPFPEGETTRANLIPLCRRHHRLKTHAAGWNVRREDRGTVRWTTPTGKVITVEPDPDRPGQRDPPPF